MVFAAIRRGASRAPIALLALILPPWLPMDLPPAFHLWHGPLAALVWLAVAGGLASSFVQERTRLRRPEVAAGVLAFVIGLAAWWQVAPQVPGGDEPHYLIITQSLLKDGDLRIENNHRARDYRSYFAGELRPDFRVRGRNQEIYSIHAPGVSALVAPAFVIAGYPGAVLLLLVMSVFGSALAWHLAWIVTGRHDAAWFGWAAVTLSSTWIFHSFTIYPDGPGAVLLLTGVWALLRVEREAADGGESIRPWFWHGAALAALPWMHTRFAVLAAGIGALILLRMARVPNAASKAFAFLAIPAVSCLAWLAYFIGIYGTADPSAPYGGEEGSFSFVAGGLAGLLFDQRFGLLAYAPALAFAVAGIGIMAARPAWRRHAIELLFVLIPYLVVVTYVAMWWGGRSAPARFFVPVLLWMAIPAAACWTAIERRATKVVALAALVFTAFASAVLVVAADGAMAFNVREAPAQWLEWLNGTVDLAGALPLWNQMRTTQVPIFRALAIWTGAALAAWYAVRAIDDRSGGSVARTVTVAAIVFAVAASAAAALNWTATGAAGRLTTSSQIEVLRRIGAERRLLPLQLTPFHRLSRADVAPAILLAPVRATAAGGAGPNDRPLYSLPGIPAGDYRVTPLASGSDGWIMIGIGRDQFAIRTEQLSSAAAGLVVRFPVDVRALIVRGDEDARRAVRGLRIEPLRPVLPEDRLTPAYARHAVRYGATTTFFMDDGSYAEPEAFWVRGESVSEIVIDPDEPHPAETLIVRNGAVENSVLIETKGWREELRLGAGEERRVQVPMDHSRGATLVRFTTVKGFTPSQADPRSRDTRFLGVWVKVNAER